MKILHVTSEVTPYSKTGGLGDVSAALPHAQSHLGHDIRVLTPYYASVQGVSEALDKNLKTSLVAGSEKFEAAFVEHYNGSDVLTLFLDCPPLFHRTGLYIDPVQNRDYGDNDVRFSMLSRAAFAYCELIDWIPDIIHAHDWQAGMTPLLMRLSASSERFTKTRSVFTIHNMAYQGLFPRSSLTYLPEIEKYFTLGGPIEFHGMISFLKSAIESADAVNTVSPTYAKEIQSSSEFGFGLEEVLHANRDRFRGILNGIDTVSWNPARDEKIEVRYSRDFVAKKIENKKALCERTGLQYRRGIPLIGMITRITEQKGFELLIPIMEEVLNIPVQFVLLGTGDPYYQHLLLDLAGRFPDRVYVTIAYDDEYAHQIEAGADMFLMPSKFEPCGLNQMMSMQYGTPPIVRATGGLEDSVIDADKDQETGTGFKFGSYESAALLNAIRRAVEAYHHPTRWKKIQRNAMAQDFSWEQSAAHYVELYDEILAQPAWRQS